MHPYESLPPSAFWRRAVAEQHMFDIAGLWQPRFAITRETRIATFGSCFAQNIGRQLRQHGFSWVNGEPAPEAASPETRARFSYDQFSARTGNIYTTSLLRQWLRWAAGDLPPPREVWEQNGRFYDPFRPVVEPDGFASADELLASRAFTITSMRRAVEDSQIVLFTLGLAESWHRAEGDTEYPMCPGTAAGLFDPAAYRFNAQSYDDIWLGLRRSIALMRKMRPGLKILLTVSPVPITATNTGAHVLTANTAAKSMLRAAAESAKRAFDWVDYFPSYELISQPPFRGVFYGANMRSVNATGIDFVMRAFFNGIGQGPEPGSPLATAAPEDIACEEELLDTAGR